MLALALAVLVALPQAREGATEAFFERRNEVWVEYAGRHLELGAWCRDKSLVREAKREITLAEELASGRHAGVQMTLAAMKRFGDAYWNTRTRPTESTAKSYAKKAQDLRRKEQSARAEIADRAHELGLAKEAFAEYENVLRLRDQALELDAQGCIVIESGPLPLEVSERLRAEAIEINGRAWMRDEIQRQVPSLRSLWEVESDVLRVRSTASAEIAQSVHALASALVRILEQDFGGRPPERLDLLILETRADYEAWLKAAGLEKYASAQGFADSECDTAVLLREGLGESWLQGLVLHELTHLLDLGLAHTGMPDWYREGLAEQYGAAGSYRWDAATQELVVGGKLLEGDLANLRASPGAVEEILAFDALAAWAEGQASGRAGYARAWAFVRYLNTAAPPRVRERFVTWQKQCHAEGATSGRRTRDAVAASARFRALLGDSMADLEAGYAAFVAGL